MSRHERTVKTARKAGANAARRHADGERVQAPDPMAGSLLARKAATAWHEGFAAVCDASNPESKAATGYDGLGDRSGMISLDIPPGVVDPVPGGVDDHHVTVVYLGKDVSDDAFDEASERARRAASRIPGPLTASLSGIGSFPPDERGKKPVFIPASIPGGDRLRADLEDLSASEHPNWSPHATLAYFDKDDELPSAQPHKVVTITHLSVHRGDEVRRFPFGGTVTKGANGMSVLNGLEQKVGPKGWEHGWHFLGVPGVGAGVHHPSHGKGTVTAVTDKHVHVRFASGTERAFEHAPAEPGKPAGLVKRGTEASAGHTASGTFSPGYLRGEGATDTDVAELGRRYEIMHGKPPTQAQLAKIRKAKPAAATVNSARDPGSGYRTRGDAIAHAKRVHEADKAQGGTLPPLALTHTAMQEDGTRVTHAVDHEGRQYKVTLGADRNVTVTHEGRSLTEPAGGNATQKARELAGRLHQSVDHPAAAATPAPAPVDRNAAHAATAPKETPAKAAGSPDDFWATEQPKPEPAPPAPKPKFDQGAMFAEPDRLGTAPMFGDKFGTSGVATPNPDAVAPGSAAHAAAARSIAGNVRLESGLTRGQKDEAETRLYAAAKHLDAGKHEDAAAELDAVSHAAGLRGGGIIKGSTAAQARDLGKQVRADNPASAAMSGVTTPNPAAAARPRITGAWAPPVRAELGDHSASGNPNAGNAIRDAISKLAAKGAITEADRQHLERAANALSEGDHALAADHMAQAANSLTVRHGSADKAAGWARGVFQHADQQRRNRDQIRYRDEDGQIFRRITQPLAETTMGAQDRRPVISGAGRQVTANRPEANDHLDRAAMSLARGDQQGAASHLAAASLSAEPEIAQRARLQSDHLAARSELPRKPHAGQVIAEGDHQGVHWTASERRDELGNGLNQTYTLTRNGQEHRITVNHGPHATVERYLAEQGAGASKPVKWTDNVVYTGGSGGSFGSLNGHRLNADYTQGSPGVRTSVNGRHIGTAANLSDAKAKAEREARTMAPYDKEDQTQADRIERDANRVDVSDHPAVTALSPAETRNRMLAAARSLRSGNHQEAISHLSHAATAANSARWEDDLTDDTPHAAVTAHIAKLRKRTEKSGAAGEIKELTAAIISTSGRENQVRGHLATATTAIEGGDTKTAYGALDLARRHALGEFGANPLRPVLLDSGQEAAKVILRLRDTIRRTG